MKKIIYLSTIMDEAQIKCFKSNLPKGFNISFCKSDYEDEKINMMHDADYILVSTGKITSNVINACGSIKLIQRLGIGVDNIDLEAAKRKGIKVAIPYGVNAISVAEHTMLLILAVYKKLPLSDRNLRKGIWDKSEVRSKGYELNEKTLGIIGMGQIGKEIAKRAKAFNMNISYYDEIKKDIEIPYMELSDLLSQCDIISVNVPINKKTKDLINYKEIGMMKKDAILINTSRGGVVNEEALYNALESNNILGAGIDVFEQEPIHKDNPLLKLRNTVLTPHTAGVNYDVMVRTIKKSLQNVVKVNKGQELDECDLVSI